jgi:ABC-type dipeptide/oligopeptide/nickel transport system ATPase component
MNKDIIDKWEKNYDKILFITGVTGCGKTYLLNSIIKNYESIKLETINKDTIDYIKDIFTMKNINDLVMNNHSKKKVLYIDDNTFSNIKILKTISSLKKPIIMTMSLPLSSKILKFIKTQYNIELHKDLSTELNKSLTISNLQDTFYYDIFEIFNKIISNEIDVKDVDTICDENLISYLLLDNIDDYELLVKIYNSFLNYNSHIYNDVYNKIFYLIIPILNIKKSNVKIKKICKHTNYISKLIISKQKENSNIFNKNNYDKFIKDILLL